MDNLTLSVNEVLSNLGNGETSQYLLENIVDALRDDDEVKIIHPSRYFSSHDMPYSLRNEDSKFNTITINSQSINAKFDELVILIEILKQQNIHIDAICVQETWLDDTSDISRFHLEGYTCVSQGKYCCSRGGLFIYVDSKYDTKRINCCPRSNIWEGLFVEVSSEDMESALIIGNIYKPPKNNNNNENIQTFITELEPVLSYLDNTNLDAILAGDYNINLLQINERLAFAEFFDKMLSHSLFPKITVPTRFSRHNGTLIDNFYCKLSSGTIHTLSGVFYTDMSDHLPCFISIDKNHKKANHVPKFVKQKIHTPTAITALLNELRCTNISQNLNHGLDNDPNLNYEILLKHILDAKTRYLPNKYVTFKKHQHKNNKWISFGIKNSIKKT